MTRRLFIFLPLFSTLAFGFFSFLKKEDRWAVLESVQNQLFPKSKRYPSASEFEALRYLKIVSKDNSFDKEDLEFLFKGVQEIQKIGYKIDLSSSKKQMILTEFSKNRFGENWISMVLNYTLEALFGDPIYGGNVKEVGWKSFNHKTGLPRPKKRFGVVHV